MSQINLPGIHLYDDRHGTARCQFRFGSRSCMVDLKALPVGSAEWLALYHAFRAGSPLPTASRSHAGGVGSVNAVIDSFLAGKAYRRMDPRTQRAYRTPFELLRKDFGSWHVGALKRRHIVQLLDDTENNNQHNSLLIAVRKVIDQAIRMDLREDDPTTKLEKETSDNPFGRRAWTLAFIEQYRARHPIGTVARCALEIGFNTGLRISDLVLFGRQHLIDGGKSFRIVPEKTRRFGNTVVQSIRDPHLIAALAAAPVRGQRPYLCTPTGRDYNKHDLGHAIAEWCKEAGVPDFCRSHGWRKAFAVAASHAGCSDQEIMALLGDTDPTMVKLYTKERDTWLLSESAATKVQAMRARGA